MFRPGEVVFEPAPAFTDASFQQVSLYGPFEKLLWHGGQDTAELFSVISRVDVTDRTDTSMSASSKKIFNVFLAVQSFLFRKSIRSLPVHGYLF